MTAFASLRAQALARWHALSPREQRSMSVLGTLLAAVVFWSVAIAPALHTLRDSENRRAQIGQQHAHMLALQNQAQTLQTRTALAPDEALRRLQNLSPGAHMQLNVQGDRVAVQLKAVPAPVLSTWLTQIRNQAQALPLEVHLTRNTASLNTANPPLGSPANAVAWDGSLVLSLPNRAAPAN
jgi:general secretion pathway protein M